jgi:glycogen operon protein
MSEQDWAADSKTITVFLNGYGIPERDPLGERIVDDSFLLLFNASHEPVTFTMPDKPYGRMWDVVLDTADPRWPTAARRRRGARPHATIVASAHSLIALRCPATGRPSAASVLGQVVGRGASRVRGPA